MAYKLVTNTELAITFLAPETNVNFYFWCLGIAAGEEKFGKWEEGRKLFF